MSKKLVIRINNLQDIEKSDDYEVAEETAIRWDRVISVSVAAILLLVALVWGSFYFLSSEESVSETKIFDVVSETETLNIEAPVVVDKDEVEEGSAEKHQTSDDQTTGVEQETVSLSDVAKEAEKANMAEVGHIESDPQTSAADTPKTVETAPIVNANKSTAKTAPVVADAKASSNDSTVDVAPTAASVFVDPIVIESSRIVKAQLTHGVNKREPVDRLGNVVSMNADKLIRLYLFTGMEGLKGETLYHDWYLSGKKMARVKINVRSNKTSASSSKFIDQYMTGDWQVKVITSRGDELVSAQFNVTN